MRDHWSLDPRVHYLNHGSFGAVPRLTQRVQRALMDECEANPMQWFRMLPGRLAETRGRIGDYLGVGPEALALVPNATTGVNTALRSLSLRAGQRLVTTSHAYGAVLIALRQIAAEHGCEVVVADLPLDATDDDVVDAVAAAVDDRTACIVVDQVTSATAKVLPAGRISALGAERGAAVIVDGAHAPALIDTPVVGDYWTGNLHKWPCAPRGSGVLAVSPAAREAIRPLVLSWDLPSGFPTAFDYPGTSDATGWLAAPTSLDLLDELGFAERRNELGELVERGAELVAQTLGVETVDVGTPAPTMRLVRLPAGLATNEAAAQRLGAHLARHSAAEVAVTSWAGTGFIRLSAHLYSTLGEFEQTAAEYEALFADPSRLATALAAAPAP